MILVADKRGRKVAAINQIATVGSMGVLLQAKKAGLIAAVAPSLELLNDSPPDVSLVAQALERKDVLRLQPAGAYAANMLGLSEQVTA
jgi:predicted nucleic acid-binding protein